jgi:hypothetical protein
MKKSSTTVGESPSLQIDAKIRELNDWRGETLSHVRTLVKQADPLSTEEFKWRGAPVWSHDGDLCLAMEFKDKVKVTFPWGAMLPDPDKLFNNELEGKQWRAIDIYENDKINEKALKALVRAAVDFNYYKASAKPAAKSRTRKAV